jgi:hypothetical protein
MIFCCLTPGLLAVLHVLLPLLPSITQHFATRRAFKMEKVFFSLSVQLMKENQVKLLKIDFQREHIFQVFGQLGSSTGAWSTPQHGGVHGRMWMRPSRSAG